MAMKASRWAFALFLTFLIQAPFVEVSAAERAKSPPSLALCKADCSLLEGTYRCLHQCDRISDEKDKAGCADDCRDTQQTQCEAKCEKGRTPGSASKKNPHP